MAQQADQRPTVVVLDNASIHHEIDHETLERWLIEHRMMLFYLPPYSPELNMIEILWKQAKYHWRRFVTWTRDTIDSEIETGCSVPTDQLIKSVSTEHLQPVAGFEWIGEAS